MESSNYNNKKENYGQGEQPPRKRKFTELDNDGQPAAVEEHKQQQPPEELSKMPRDGLANDDLENVHLESHSREDLVNLVRKLLVEKNEAQKRLETTKKEAEQSASASSEQQMKIQLSLETWYDWLSFVPRRQLGKIVPKFVARKFASIVQKFLHEYGEIKIGHLEIVAPYEEDPDGPHPRVRAWQNHSPLRFKMAEAQMPANIKSFHYFWLSYFDQSVLNFMQKFQKNSLLDNVNLSFFNNLSRDIIQPVLCQMLPLIDGIVSIGAHSTQLFDFYDAGNSKEIYELNMKMMEKTRFLGVSNVYNTQNLDANTIDLYCRWLYQTARDDGKPRVLLLFRIHVDSEPISLFIDRIKQDFLMATNPVTFFIRIILPKAFQLENDHIFILCNDKNERLITKMEGIKKPNPDPDASVWEKVVLLISRYPLASNKKWIEENEKEVLNWKFGENKTIYLSEELKVVPI